MYNSVLVLSSKAEAPTAEQLISDLSRPDRGSRKIFAVNPASASGYIVPAAFLKKVDPKFTLPRAAVEWLQEHDEPGRRIAETQEIRSIGFVSSDTHLRDSDPVKRNCLHSTTLNEDLCDYKIPRGTVVVNDHLPTDESDQLRAFLRAALPEAVRLAQRGFPRCDYSVAAAPRELAKQLSPMKDFIIESSVQYKGELSSPKLSIDDVLNDLHAYHELYGKSPRLAFVLSGGGAKCAYQAGALVGITAAMRARRLDAVKRHDVDCSSLDADAVVGTSGGGLNALLFASEAGLDGDQTHTESILHNSWTKSSLVSVARPLKLIAVGAGWLFGIGSLYASLFCGLVWSRGHHILWGRRIDTKRAQTAFMLVGCVAVLIWVAILRYSRLEQQPSLVQFVHAFGLHPAFRWSAAIGSLAFLFFFFRKVLLLPRHAAERINNYDFLRMMAAGTLTISAFAFLMGVLLKGSSIFDSRAVQLRVRDAYVQAAGIPPLSAKANQVLGRPFVRTGLKRDLIISASVVNSPVGSPNELYFYSSRKDMEKIDARFCSLEDLPTVDALRIAAASSTVWPAFDTAKVILPKATGNCTGQSMKLADGGFVHNNPIEAGILWGATHIIVINASPEVRSSGESAADAFDYLFDQAQRIDQLARGAARVYEIRPPCTSCQEEEAYLASQRARDKKLELFPDTFTFVSDYLEAAYQRGKLDASADRFVRTRSGPVW